MRKTLLSFRAFFLSMGFPKPAFSGVFITENAHKDRVTGLHLQEKGFTPGRHGFAAGRPSALLAGVALSAMLAAPALIAQTTPQQQDAQPQQQNPDARVTGQTTTTTDEQGQKHENVSLGVKLGRKKKPKVAKEDRVKQSKDTRREVKKTARENALVGKDAALPDKVLYDKALAQEKSGHFDVARLDLQTLLNTYPDSQYQMRAKLAVADCWYREGGSAALTQAEQEYNDFITFFPNAPEAAEAQMRIGDIYFKQMDVPDRDYAKAMKAEGAYRTMIKQYPDAPKSVMDEATQKLREVQEVLATREAEIAAFYGSHENWAAAIARYQTVVDTYPQYSHMDDALIGMGDAYEAQATAVRAQPTCPATVPCLPEGAKVKILQFEDGKASDAYRRVVLEHSAAPHVEDAKERLTAMNLPIPTPTPEQAAASEALEGSRAQYNMKRRLELIFLHKPDTVTAAQIGAPPLDDPAATTAPAIINTLKDEYAAALNPNAPRPSATPAPAAPTSDAEGGAAVPPPPASTAAPTLSDVPAAGEGTGEGSTSTMTVASPSTASRRAGASLGVEVITPGASGSASEGGAPATTPGTVRAVPKFGAPPSDLPAATGAPDPNFGLPTAKPANAAAAPAVEKPEEAPDQINELAGQKQQPIPQPTQPANAKGKKKQTKAPAVDKNDESSSKDKKKKGLDKLNPF